MVIDRIIGWFVLGVSLIFWFNFINTFLDKEKYNDESTLWFVFGVVSVVTGLLFLFIQ